MLTFVAIVHIIFCFSLIALVLLQDPKGGGTGVFGSGGGGANSLLGATGQTSFFAKLTRYSAVIFGITCLTMTILTRRGSESVINGSVAIPAPPPSSAPAQQVPGSATSGAAGASAPPSTAPISMPSAPAAAPAPGAKDAAPSAPSDPTKK